MAPGDGPSDDGAEISTGSPGGEPADAPPYVRSRTDPSVEGGWLAHMTATPPHRHGGPRLSTVFLAAAFVAVLVLYIVLRQSG
ncbi:hypothetical protein AB0H00_26995 [Nocardia sp. NPDC023852]|uniref:hypothetical protein n=1 Tax=Nocardia sp. NPDC023852 TaxID=3154697 RepID=UPI0033E6BB23